ncbi:MAG: type IV pilin N-terminal domain-containing protein [Methanolinea sp.]|nr:type IV pilin N-terminal domain-containing protein [Methanolinea sp.]
MKIMKNDEAVSPVIGVILMVAITVILAAVIAAFVFGLAGTTSTTKNVGVTAGLNGSGYASITWQGGTDLGKIVSWEGKLENGTRVVGNIDVNQKPSVGQVNTTEIGISGHRLIITAKFEDGSSQVIFDKQF